MDNIRVIPRLDIKGPNLVKGIHLEGLRVLGQPESFARTYYEEGADELIYMDVVASLYGRNSLVDFIKKTSKEVFIPLTVGGGLRSLEDIRSVLLAGADKVALNTAAISDPALITKAAERFGSSTIVISIEAIQKPDGSYEAFTDNGREETGVDVFSWAKQVEDLGAGEIMVTSIDREGTGKGYDVDLTRRVSESVSIPVIACGGAGKGDDVMEVIHEGRVNAVGLASLLHYHYLKFARFRDETEEGNTEYLKTQQNGVVLGFSKVEETSLPSLKRHMSVQGVSCRIVGEGGIDADV
ncbi:MAG TPA: imidazole glycerol phosphate synthase subunit HisF [Candidatus Latescibacteria bacterium]|nr:imidazole glycerol phosphate synthase subunit HisF [Candidatus Latescibacterota bacterium]